MVQLCRSDPNDENIFLYCLAKKLVENISDELTEPKLVDPNLSRAITSIFKAFPVY